MEKEDTREDSNTILLRDEIKSLKEENEKLKKDMKKMRRERDEAIGKQNFYVCLIFFSTTN